MRNIRLNIQYDGTNFVGWQRQKNGISVQEVIESAVSKILNQEIKLISAGRTDAGVHARQQVANFFTSNNKISPSELKSGVNSLLPPDIRITSVKQVDKEFHARFDVKYKIYRYFIYNGEVLSPFQYRYIWHIPQKLNYKIMENECKYLIGKKDFKYFQARGSSVKNTVRNIYKARLIAKRKYITFEIQADGFLYKMVRLIVGTLVEVGRGKYSPGWIKYLLKGNKGYRPGPTAPPQGLFLWRVVY